MARAQGSVTKVESGVKGYFSEGNWGVMAGGGLNAFTNGDANSAIDPGLSYTARLFVGTERPLGFELGYAGAVADVHALGLDERALLVSNGLEGNVRYNILRGMWQPYVLGGVGWRHYGMSKERFNTSSANNSDNVLEVPLGAGLAWYHPSGLMVDGRAAYALSAGSDLLGGAGGGGPDLNNWNFSIKGGWVF
jgi:hypothetical protein